MTNLELTKEFVMAVAFAHVALMVVGVVVLIAILLFMGDES